MTDEYEYDVLVSINGDDSDELLDMPSWYERWAATIAAGGASDYLFIEVTGYQCRLCEKVLEGDNPDKEYEHIVTYHPDELAVYALAKQGEYPD